MNATKTAKDILKDLTPDGTLVTDLPHEKSLARTGNRMLAGKRPKHSKTIHNSLKSDGFPMGRIIKASI